MNVHCTMPQTYEVTFTMALLQKEIRIFFIFIIWAWIFLTILLKIFFAEGKWNTLLFVPLLFVEMALKGSKQGVIGDNLVQHLTIGFVSPWTQNQIQIQNFDPQKSQTLSLFVVVAWSKFVLQMKYFVSYPLLLLLMILTKPKPSPRHWEPPRLTRRRCENIEIEEVVGICSNMKTFKC